MAWPLAKDYQEAVQNPRTAFADPELMNSIPVTDKLGLPRAISGNFAIVFQLAAGSRRTVVRCFLRQQPDRDRRYEALSSYLAPRNLSCLVPFRYLRQGIRVAGSWYPILTMEWVEGVPLHQYVEANLASPDALRTVAESFRSATRELAAHSIAHGDLQHRNIMVVGGRVKLIDYDGMYVPSLAGMGAAEIGQRNFQHPARDEKAFGPFLDHFSGWVIYLSLVSIFRNPHLWTALRGGDECLILRKEDFDDPQASDAFFELGRIRLKSGDSISARLLGALYTPLARIPPVHDAPALEFTEDQPARTGVAEVATAAASPSWLSDHLPAPAMLTFDGHTFVPERIAAGVALSFAVSAVGLATAGVLAPPVAAAAGVGSALAPGLTAIHRFSQQPHVRQKRELTSQLRATGRKLSDLRNSETQNARLLERLNSEERAHPLQTQTSAISAAQGKELASVDQRLLSETQEIQRRRQSLANEESGEVSRAYDAFLSQAMNRGLSEATVEAAEIPGIGRGLKERLILSGIRTAADIDQWSVARIRGFGDARVSAILAWRHTVEAAIRRALPSSLPQTYVSGIAAKYRARQETLRQEEDAVRERARRTKHEIQVRFHQNQLAIERQLVDLRAQYERARAVLAATRQKLAAESKDVERRQAAVARELQTYRRITALEYVSRAAGLSGKKPT